MKAKVDRETCLGCGICIDLCPEVFESDDEGLAIVIVDAVPPELETTVQDAAEQCPEGAIHVEE